MAHVPPPHQAPPGWYPDPQGAGQRWWDGWRWSEQVAPIAAPAPAPTTWDQARQWAMLGHVSALGALVVGLPWIGPLVVYLAKRDDHPFIADQAREALNFNLSMFIYQLVAVGLMVVLFIVLVGLLLIPVVIGLWIAWLVLVILAAVAANNGEAYRYPLTIRMVS